MKSINKRLKMSHIIITLYVEESDSKVAELRDLSEDFLSDEVDTPMLWP